jgi:hypothetical protein
LLHADHGGEAIPVLDGVQKVFVAENNILIGSAGIIILKSIEYEFKTWITEFIETHHGAPSKRPSDFAAMLDQKMRETFHAEEALKKTSVWEANGPGDRIVSFAVAGYAENFNRPYLFEIGTEVNADRRSLKYVPPLKHNAQQLFWFGEDEFWRLAMRGLEPQASARSSFLTSIRDQIDASVPEIPVSLKDAMLSVVSLIQVEAQFNPKKVGGRVRVAVIEREKKAAFLATF